MQISSRGQSGKQPGPESMFAGEVVLDRLAAGQDALPSAAAVTFRQGARTHWHSHGGGQVLYVIEGEGRIGTADEERTLRPGDLVVAPAGELHWHGAAEGHDMTHLALSFGEATWGDPVS